MNKALQDDILVEVESIEQVSSGGIVIARDAVEKDKSTCQIGIVRDLGPLAVVHVDDDRKIKVGDRVLFTRYAGMLVPKDFSEDKVLRIVKELDLHMLLDYKKETKEVMSNE